MIVWVLIFLSLLAGVLAGLYAGYCKWEYKYNNQKIKSLFTRSQQVCKQWISKIQNKIKRTFKTKKENEDLLKKKIPKCDTTLDEFNCAADGTDYQEYLQKVRDQENDAYKMLAQK